MKLYRNAIILVIVLALLVGATVFFKNLKDKSDDTSNKKYEKLIDLSTIDMEEVTVEMENETIIIAKPDKEWILKYPEGIRYDANKLSGIAINFSSVFIEKLIEENAADLSQYGLDKPIIVTAKMNDGSTVTLEIGNLTPTGGTYYVKKRGSNDVYTTDPYTIDKIILGKNDIRNDFLFNISSKDITRVAMERKGNLIFNASIGDNEVNWTLTSPIQGEARNEEIIKVLDAITQSYVTGYIEENPSDLEQYGLSKPSYVLEFESIEGKTRMLMGKENPAEGEIYAMIDGGNEVYTISLEPFVFLDKPLKEIVEVFAYLAYIWDVEKIDVEIDGQVQHLGIDVEKGGTDDRFTVNGRDASLVDEYGEQPFKSYYTSLIAIILSEVEPDANPTGEAEITITYHMKESSMDGAKVMKVEFIPKDNRYYYVVRNGEYSGILVEKKQFDRPDGVRDSYKKLIEAMDAAETESGE